MIHIIDPGKEICLERVKQDNRPPETAETIEAWYAGREKGRNMRYKNVEAAEIKLDGGSISGFFSTYDKTPDSYGDVIMPGAFKGTIERRKASGHPFPLCWNHDLDQIIGAVDPEKIEEQEKGPYMREAPFFDTPLAQEKRALVMSGCVYQFSFAYDVLESRKPTEAEKAAGIWNVLEQVELYEISIVPIPANQHAVITDVKSGRRNSAKDLSLIDDAISKVEEVISAANDTINTLRDLRGLDDADEPEGEDETEDNAAAEDPKGSNPEKERLLELIKNIEKKEK